MKKVVALLGSNRKGNTDRLLRQIGALLAARGVELEIVGLYRRDVRDCLGCEACLLRGTCVLDDGAPALMAELAAADGVILASPVYLRQVSGKMKTFFDRTCSWYHRPALAGKPVLAVATTKGSGLRATLAYLSDVAAQWGGLPAGRVGRTIFREKEPVREREIARFCRLLDDPRSFSPPLKLLLGFEVQKSLARFLGGLDGAYWRAMGWTDAAYFIPCRIPPLRRAVSGLAGRAIRRGMARGKPQEPPT